MVIEFFDHPEPQQAPDNPRGKHASVRDEHLLVNIEYVVSQSTQTFSAGSRVTAVPIRARK
jgi:hypothetical protein